VTGHDTSNVTGFVACNLTGQVTDHMTGQAVEKNMQLNNNQFFLFKVTTVSYRLYSDRQYIHKNGVLADTVECVVRP
jgi:hypothetical protein